MTQQAQPLVSVIIPTYNREKLLKRAIDSVLYQTYKNIEIIVVDDGSTDNTEKIVKEINSPKIRYYKNKINLGAQKSRNNGLKKAQGEYIAFLDSDNEWLPNKLELQYNTFCNTSKKIGVIYSYNYVVDEINNSRSEWCFKLQDNVYRDLLKSPSIDFITALIRRECFEKIGFLDEDVPSFHEWDTFIRLSKYYEFECIPQKLAIYYTHSGPTISKNLRKFVDGYSYIIKKHKREIIKNCGYHIMGEHYLNLMRYYLNCSRYGQSIIQYFKAIIYNPFYIFSVPSVFFIKLLKLIKKQIVSRSEKSA